MPALILAFFALCVPTLMGFFALRMLFKDQGPDTLTLFALGYLLGTGLLSLGMLLWGWAGLNFQIGPLTTVWVIMIALVAIASYRVRDRICDPQPHNAFTISLFSFKPIDIVLWIFIILSMAYIFWNAVSIPFNVWDEIERVALKAKVFYFDRNLKDAAYLPYPSYPLHMELSATWINLHFPVWSDQWPKILTPVMMLAFLRIQFFFLRKFISNSWALAADALLLCPPLLVHHASIVYCDLPLALYSTTSILFLILWHAEENFRYLIGAALFSGLCGWIKIEGIGHSLIHVLIFVGLLPRISPTLHGKINASFFFIVILFCLSVIYPLFTYFQHIPLPEKCSMDLSAANLGHRFPIIFEAFIRNLFLSGNWGLAWILFLVSFIHFAKITQSLILQVLLLALAAFIGLYSIVFIATPSFVWVGGDKFYTTFSREILQFFPLVVLSIVLLNAPMICTSGKDSKS